MINKYIIAIDTAKQWGVAVYCVNTNIFLTILESTKNINKKKHQCGYGLPGLVKAIKKSIAVIKSLNTDNNDLILIFEKPTVRFAGTSLYYGMIIGYISLLTKILIIENNLESRLKIYTIAPSCWKKYFNLKGNDNEKKYVPLFKEICITNNIKIDPIKYSDDAYAACCIALFAANSSLSKYEMKELYYE